MDTNYKSYCDSSFREHFCNKLNYIEKVKFKYSKPVIYNLLTLQKSVPLNFFEFHEIEKIPQNFTEIWRNLWNSQEYFV